MNKFMRLAFKLAKKANPFPNPRVGAVLVRDGSIIGQGYHSGPGQPHAEIVAIKDARKKGANVSGSALYVTLEPCSHLHFLKRTPPCTAAISSNGITHLIYAMKDPNPFVNGKGIADLQKNGVKVTGPTDGPIAQKLNPEYLKHLGEKSYVSIKMAMSLDGKSATKTGDSKWISSPQSLDYVHRLRAEYDAVMVGAGTIKCDDPQLTSHGKGKDPYRIIIDGQLSIPPSCKVLKNQDGKTIVVTSASSPAKKRAKIRNLIFCAKDGKVDLPELVRTLGTLGIKKIMIEGGNELNAAALEAKIVDQITIFIAPKIIGGKGALPVVGGSGIEKMSDALMLGNFKMRKLGRDVMLEASVLK